MSLPYGGGICGFRTRIPGGPVLLGLLYDIKQEHLLVYNSKTKFSCDIQVILANMNYQ